ncbi:hypothetical protein SBF1_8550002 [Candidatus Desulfosporosinus infrequens]|uniref:Uncharacterized protein n=1 Tax=Candidatus Desulfosporosinus infrequens TaxID=2043169 RepID=A0A2U3LV67_9FIRM|nr:hypothetical protein SBF1_8550002 [Candidatus Desulfosporosinus infrequens]
MFSWIIFVYPGRNCRKDVEILEWNNLGLENLLMSRINKVNRKEDACDKVYGLFVLYAFCWYFSVLGS